MKPTTAVDRALEDVNRQIAELQRQTAARSTPPPAPAAPSAARKFIQEILTPPKSQPGKPAYRTAPQFVEEHPDPVAELTADPLPFAPKTDLDLFDHAATPRTETRPGNKLGELLGAGIFQHPKPTIKRIERANRNRFFMWLGLALVALWLIIVVIR